MPIRWFASFVVASALTSAATSAAQSSASHLTIPFLASENNPDDPQFEGAECDVDSAAGRMTCGFQQVFLTTSQYAPDTCLVTTNRYERTFRRDAPDRWISTEGPDGICGILDVVTLKDGGTVRWTMEVRKDVTKKDAAPACLSIEAKPEVYSWQHIRRPLPCRFVQPGGLIP